MLIPRSLEPYLAERGHGQTHIRDSIHLRLHFDCVVYSGKYHLLTHAWVGSASPRSRRLDVGYEPGAAGAGCLYRETRDSHRRRLRPIDSLARAPARSAGAPTNWHIDADQDRDRPNPRSPSPRPDPRDRGFRPRPPAEG